LISLAALPIALHGKMTAPTLDPQDAFEVLVAAPGTKEEKQEFFLDQFEVKVPRTNYDLMWDRLVDELGEDEAADAVCSLVLSAADSRALELLERVAEGQSISLRATEPSLVELLFDADDELTPVGEVLADRLRRTPSPTPNSAPAPKPISEPAGPAEPPHRLVRCHLLRERM
jgi:hypothetical protein